MDAYVCNAGFEWHLHASLLACIEPLRRKVMCQRFGRALFVDLQRQCSVVQLATQRLSSC